MIIVRLKGGLGNQLFQYALGRKLSLKNGDVLKFDIDFYKKNEHLKTHETPREFKLPFFNIDIHIATEEEVRRCGTPYGVFSKIYQKIYSKITDNYWTNYYPHILAKQNDVYLDGYWQTEHYFGDIKETLLKDLTLKEPLEEKVPALLEMMRSSEGIAVQVRRGDYTETPFLRRYWGICSSKYYADALEYIRTKIGGRGRVFLFSDNPLWAMENLELPEDTVVVGKEFKLTDYEELVAMGHAKHAILSNSTFGWWGAWLIQNPAKIVVAPEPWSNLHQRRHKDIIPDSWIRLPKN